jgi:RND superfamily putative drug exporter
MTIGIGLLVDTLIVRSFMTPSIAAALGRWFWWPLNTFNILDRYRVTSEKLSEETSSAGYESHASRV